VYARQSVTDLDDEGHVKGASLAVQEKLCRERPEFVKCHVEVFTDPDVSGGKEDKRPEYQRMMTRLCEAPAGTIGAVVAYDLSRLHRNTANFFNFMAEMEARGILVFTATEGLQHSDDSLSWGVKALVAAEYRRKTGQNIHVNKAHQRAKGIMQGRLPVGYRKGKNGKAVVDKKAAPVVKDLFSRYATGNYSLTTLADWMNAQGIKPPAVPFRPTRPRRATPIGTGVTFGPPPPSGACWARPAT
jgi:DNA invertase Pin-like site-specific DNA recombinase